jgi:hypothetical protein
MKEERCYIEKDENNLVFASRTVLVPGRKVEIGFAVSKKSAFPIVEELILKLLKMVGSSSLDVIVTFLDFSEREIRDVLRPLLGKGFVIIEENEYRLSEMGNMLFSSSDGVPAISESESLERDFKVDDHCGLPVEFSRIGEHIKTGALKWFIEELPVSPMQEPSPNEKALQSFNNSFEHFIKNEKALENIRNEKLTLHKTEYCKFKESFIIQSDIVDTFLKSAIVSNRVIPFDNLQPKTDDRRDLRDRLVQLVKVNTHSESKGDIEFFRNLFGADFIEGCFNQDVIAWFKIIPRFFNENWPRLQSGAHLVIGEACLPRNITLIVELFEKLISEREVSIEAPLKIIWIRPAVVTWGRSIGFLDAIERLRETSREVLKGAVQIELWENRNGFDEKSMPEQRSYKPWFYDLRRFTSDKIPPKMEMLLIGDAGGIVLTHAFTPPQACFSCPIGVYFEEHAAFQELMNSEVHGGLRSLPRLEKKKIKGDRR